MKRSQFISAVYGLVGIPETGQNIDIGIAWAASEGSRADNNALDTEQPEPGSTDFNTAGVKNYPSWTEGVDATVATLTNGDYDAVLTALKSPDTNAMDKLNAINSSPWGSHITTQLYTDVVGNRAKYDTEVTGSPQGSDNEPQKIEANAPKFEQLPVLQVGAEGRPVEILTTLLNQEHALTDSANPLSIVAIGDKFGPEVEAAVKDHQTKKGIEVDGIVGPETWSSFFY